MVIHVRASPRSLTNVTITRNVLATHNNVASRTTIITHNVNGYYMSNTKTLRVSCGGGAMRISNVGLGRNSCVSVGNAANAICIKGMRAGTTRLSNSFTRLVALTSGCAGLRIHAGTSAPRSTAVTHGFNTMNVNLYHARRVFFRNRGVGTVHRVVLTRSTRKHGGTLTGVLPCRGRSFGNVFGTVTNYPMAIHLLSPPLRRFIPRSLGNRRRVTRTVNMSMGRVRGQIRSLYRRGPVLKRQNYHLNGACPRVARVRAHTVLKTTLRLGGRNVRTGPRVVIPLANVLCRFGRRRGIVHGTTTRLFRRVKSDVSFGINAVVRVPHTTLATSHVTSSTRFFSFNAGSLARVAFNCSHSSVTSFLPICLRGGVLGISPFRILSRGKIKRLIHVTARGKHTVHPSLGYNVYNRRNNRPSSIGFYRGMKLGCMSYSPFHIPVTHVTTTRTTVRRTWVMWSGR